MTTRTHNDFLDADQSEDDGSQGYDSEAEDLKKGGRSPKRRRVDSDVSDEEGKEEDEESNGEELDDQEDEEDVDMTSPSHKEPTSKGAPKPKELPGISKPLSQKALVASAAAVKRSGVVYISRIPPSMKPQKIRSLLEPYGTLNRIFLSPENSTSRSRRIRNGGNKKKSYSDGWVEFVRKSDAKEACELLNAKPIGGKKGTYYRDDLWNITYLKGFKWTHLTQQIAEENAQRASQMRAEISKNTRENKEFVQKLERAKMLEGMEAKRAAKKPKDDEDTTAIEEKAPAKESKKGGERPRHFAQTQVVAKRKPANQPDETKAAVISSIFG